MDIQIYTVSLKPIRSLLISPLLVQYQSPVAVPGFAIELAWVELGGPGPGYFKL
jgi:hypothetical protein